MLQNLKLVFSYFTKIKLGQKGKYNINILLNYDIDVQGIDYYRMVMLYILNSSSNQHAKK
jgi:hypothetical protein